MVINCELCKAKNTSELLYQQDKSNEGKTYKFGCLQCNQTFEVDESRLDKILEEKG